MYEGAERKTINFRWTRNVILVLLVTIYQIRGDNADRLLYYFII